MTVVYGMHLGVQDPNTTFFSGKKASIATDCIVSPKPFQKREYMYITLDTLLMSDRVLVVHKYTIILYNIESKPQAQEKGKMAWWRWSEGPYALVKY